MEIQGVVDASVDGWNHHRRRVCQEADVADQSFVDDCMNGLTVIDGAFREPSHVGPVGGGGHLVVVSSATWSLLMGACAAIGIGEGEILLRDSQKTEMSDAAITR